MQHQEDARTPIVGVGSYLHRREKILKIKLGEMKDEKERLHKFLVSRLSDGVSSKHNEITVESQATSASKLKQLANKFVYRRNLMNKFWVELNGDEIRIHTFKHRKESKEPKKGTPPSIIKHGF